jgi:hypothetical protein
MPAKNTLITADSTAIESAFAERLGALMQDADLASGLDVQPTEPEAQSERQNASNPRPDDPEGVPVTGIDKSQLAIAEPRRYRSKQHLRFVAQQPCLVCGRKPSDLHHIRTAQRRAFGRKVSDEYVVPLCRTHHRAAHRIGDERRFWQEVGIDALAVARKLWAATRRVQGQSPA